MQTPTCVQQYLSSHGIESITFSPPKDSFQLNPIEKYFFDLSKKKLSYKGEHIPMIETEDSKNLGKLAVLSFLQWANENPKGVVAFSTGKISILFIKYLRYYKYHWNDPIVQEELKKIHFPTKDYPDTTQLKVIQNTEFFPINTKKENSLSFFFKKYIAKLLNIAPENLLSMEDSYVPTLKKYGINEIFPNGKVDLSLLTKAPKNKLEYLQLLALQEINAFCNNFEKKIKEWGGIDFILAGIGTEGRVGYNQKGSSFTSKTRLVPLKYEVAAAISEKVGGIEYSRNLHAITIGLSTLFSKKTAKIIIYTSDPYKAKAISKTIQCHQPQLEVPCSIFLNSPHFCIYLTKKVARHLSTRKHVEHIGKSFKDIPKIFLEQSVIKLSLERKKPLLLLTKKDFYSDPATKFIYKKCSKDPQKILVPLQKKLIHHLENSLLADPPSCILHTSPYHEDIILAYYPIIKHLVRSSKNLFCVFTNGYQNVTYHFLINQLKKIKEEIDSNYEAIKSTPYINILDKFKETFRNTDREKKSIIETQIIAKKLFASINPESKEEISDKLNFLVNYTNNRYPGQNDSLLIQSLKGLIREAEEEKTWFSCCGIPPQDIYHMRAQFFSSDPYSSTFIPEFDKNRMIQLINDLNPTVITVAYDLKEIAPDTYYKCLKCLFLALKDSSLNKKISIWAYHNYRDTFSFSEANVFHLVSKEEINEVSEIFNHCYSTQKDASFPSLFFDGSYPHYVKSKQEQSLQELKTLLGENFFKYHPNKIIRNAKGIILLKQVTCKQFLRRFQRLHKEFNIQKSEDK